MEYTDIYIVNTKAFLEKGEKGVWELEKLLEKELLSRILKKKNERARFESLLSYSLLTCVLLKEGLSEKDMKITFSASGKPHLLNNSSLTFSLSHTEGAVCVAINKASKGVSSVGVDIERISEKSKNAARKAEGRFFEKPLPNSEKAPLPMRVYEWTYEDGAFFEKRELEPLPADNEPLKKWCEGEAYFKMSSDTKGSYTEKPCEKCLKGSFSVELCGDLFTVAVTRI